MSEFLLTKPEPTYLIVDSPQYTRIVGSPALEVTEPTGLTVIYADDLISSHQLGHVLSALVRVEAEGSYHLEWTGLETAERAESDIEVVHTTRLDVLS